MRYWTVAEAREYLPRLRRLVETVRGAVATSARAATNGASGGGGHGAQGRRPTAGGTRPGGTAPATTVREALAELEANDIVLRDPGTGLTDFHARGADGVVYLLCWRLDEDDLGWWHLPDEGFAGRKPLPRHPA